MNMEPRKRYEEIDLAKGIGMLAVIWGHLMLGGSTNRFVYAFHIPLFFFLSGLLFRRERYRNFGAFVGHRARTLLLPYAVFSAVTWLYWVVRNLVLDLPVKSWFSPLLQTVLAQDKTAASPSATHFWVSISGCFIPTRSSASQQACF